MFKVGDKVCIPETKSVECFVGGFITYGSVKELFEIFTLPLLKSILEERDQEFLYIVGIKDHGYILDIKSDISGVGWYFLEQDLTPYNPEEDYIGGVVDV